MWISPQRCSCPPELDARGRRKACSIEHGSWGYTVDLDPGLGPDGEYVERHQVSRFGFPTKKDAEKALAEVLDANASRLPSQRSPVGADRRGTLLWVTGRAPLGGRASARAIRGAASAVEDLRSIVIWSPRGRPGMLLDRLSRGRPAVARRFGVPSEA